MSYINGILTVPAFTATGNPGEFTIEGATYTNQSDNAGVGAAAITPGFVLYVQASDANTFFAIPGIAHRYAVTAVLVIDQATVNLTVLWDEPGDPQDVPTNGVDCIITSVSTSQKYDYPVGSDLYPSLGAGLVSGMLDRDIQNITDMLAAASAVVQSVNGIAGNVVLAAGDNVEIDVSGSTLTIKSTGADEGTY